MRLREFNVIKEAPIGSGGGELGQQFAMGAQTVAGTINDYVQLLFKYRAEKNAKKKAQQEKVLRQKAAKLTPQQKKDVKTQISKVTPQQQTRKSTTPGKPTIGQIAQGSDGRTYRWAGQQWIGPTGAIKRKNVTVSVQ